MSVVVSLVMVSLVIKYTVNQGRGGWLLPEGNSSTLDWLSTGDKETEKTEYRGWVAWWNEDAALISLEDANERLSRVLPVWYAIDEDGRWKETGARRQEEMRQLFEDKDMKVMPTIGNDFDKQRVSKLLSDQRLRTAFIEQTIRLAKEKGYDGWDVDWEQIDTADSQRFAEFVAEWTKALHAEGLETSVDVHALTGSKSDWVEALGHDYQLLAKSADWVQVMAYDYHFSESAPGPITPLNWLREVIEYSINYIPEEKLVLGLPVYGYDWSGNSGESIQYYEAMRRLNGYGGEWERDKTSGALKGEYEAGGQNHVIWFEDAESVVQKVKLAERYGINKFVFWRLGDEDERMWEMLPER